MQIIRATQALTPQGWQSDIDVVIASDGRIETVAEASGSFDIKVDILLPAPTNVHSHSFQRAMAGLTEARGGVVQNSFWSWRKLMYRFLEQLTPDHIEAIASQAFMEMAEAGYAAVAEFHYIHHAPVGQAYDSIFELSERIAASAFQTGLGLIHLPVHYEFGGCDGRSLQGGQRRFGTTKAQYETLFAAVQRIISAGPKDWALGAAPHSLRAVDNDGLNLAFILAGTGPLHMHLAEQTAEVDEVTSYLGARPVEWVLNNLQVDSRCCFIHCTQMTVAETRTLAKSRATVGLCPITEANLGDGIFPCVDYTRDSGCFGIGSDSNIQISLWEELKSLEYSQRLKHQHRAMLAKSGRSTGRVLFEAACYGGKLATGRLSGTLASGYWADLIGVSTKNVVLCARSEDIILDSLIFANHGQSCINHVWSAGRHIVQDGRHIAYDLISRQFINVMRELKRDI